MARLTRNQQTDKLLQALFAVALAVATPRPTTRSTLAFFELLSSSTNATFSRLHQLGVFDPANELVASQRCDVLPGVKS
jgi:hypothetical protein